MDAEIGHKELDWKITLSGVGKCRQVIYIHCYYFIFVIFFLSIYANLYSRARLVYLKAELMMLLEN